MTNVWSRVECLLPTSAHANLTGEAEQAFVDEATGCILTKNNKLRWALILSQSGICSRTGRRMTTFEDALSIPVLLDGIRETREVLHIPNCHFSVSSSARAKCWWLTRCLTKIGMFLTDLFADWTSRKRISHSGPIPLSISGKNGKMGIAMVI